MTKWNWAEGKEGGIPPAPECQLVQSQTWFSEPPGSLARTHGWASPPPSTSVSGDLGRGQKICISNKFWSFCSSH